MSHNSSMRERIKRVLIDSLRLEGVTPEMIGDDDPLFGDGLGLDSVDALELVVALEKEYGFRIDSEQMNREDFSSVASLAAFVERLAGSPEVAGTE
jgi:acyl carrier protein